MPIFSVSAVFQYRMSKFKFVLIPLCTSMDVKGHRLYCSLMNTLNIDEYQMWAYATVTELKLKLK